MGLEQSKQKFIWVLRDADKGDIFAEDMQRNQLPEGYEERVKEVWNGGERLGTSSRNFGTSVNGWVHESLWMELMLGEYNHWSAYSCLADAL